MTTSHNLNLGSFSWGTSGDGATESTQPTLFDPKADGKVQGLVFSDVSTANNAEIADQNLLDTRQAGFHNVPVGSPVNPEDRYEDWGHGGVTDDSTLGDDSPMLFRPEDVGVTKGLVVPGVTGNNVSMPDAVPINNNLDVRARIQPKKWINGEQVIASTIDVGTSKGWEFVLTAAGELKLTINAQEWTPPQGSFASGTFTLPASTGNLAVTGVGFQPTAVIFFTSGGTTSSGASSSLVPLLRGAMTATEASSTAAHTDATISRHRLSRSSVAMENGGTNPPWEWDCASMDADGFTMNFSRASASGVKVGFLAIGGATAKIINWDLPTATGPASVVGLGFKPTFLMHMMGSDTSHGASIADSFIGTGFVGRMGNHVESQGWKDGQRSTATSWNNLRTQKYGIKVKEGLTTLYEVRSKHFDDDGFTIDVETANASSFPVATLCLDLVDAVTRPFSSGGATGSVVTDFLGHQTDALLFNYSRSHSGGHLETNGDGSYYPSIGVHTPTDGHSAGWSAMISSASTSYNDSRWRTSTPLYGQFLNEEMRGSVTAVGTNSFTVNWAQHALASAQGFCAISLAKDVSQVDSYTKRITDRGNIAYWPMDEVLSSGSVDRGYFGEHLIVQGTVAGSTNGPWAGKNSLDFTGASTDVTYADASRFWDVGTVDDFSISVWARCDGGSSYRAIAGTRWEAHDVNAELQIYFDEFGKLALWGRTTTATWAKNDTYGAFTLNQWYHVVVTFDASASTARFYVDGVEIGSPLTGLNNLLPGYLSFGVVRDSTPAWAFNLNGKLSQASAYDRLLTSAEVLALYDGTATPSYEPSIAASKIDVAKLYYNAVLADNPLAYWQLNEVSGTNLTDAMGNVDATLAGTQYTLGGQSIPGDIGGSAVTGASFGHNDDMTTASSAAIAITGSTYSMEAWIRPSSYTSSNFNEILWWDTSAASFSVAEIRLSDGFIEGTYYQSSTSQYTITAGTRITANNLYHVVLSVNGSYVDLYVNGVKAANTVTAAAHTVDAGNRYVTIGNHGGQTAGFIGEIDEAAIYDYALTEAQALSHYDLGNPNSSVAPYMTWENMLVQAFSTSEPMVLDTPAHNQGDILVAAITYNRVSDGGTITPPAGWTERIHAVGTGSWCKIAVFTKTAGASEASTMSFEFSISSSGRDGGGVIVALDQALVSTEAPDVIANIEGLSATTNTLDIEGITPTGKSAILVFASLADADTDMPTVAPVPASDMTLQAWGYGASTNAIYFAAGYATETTEDAVVSQDWTLTGRIAGSDYAAVTLAWDANV